MFQFLFCYILERKDKKSFKRNIIVLISFLILFVSISFLVNIGEEMSLPGFRGFKRDIIVLISFLILFISISFLVNIVHSGVPYIPNDLRAHTTGKIKVLLCSSFMPTFNPVSRAYIVTGMRKG